MAKKDKKGKKENQAVKKARTQEKTERKLAKKQTKQGKKEHKNAEPEEDIETILANFKKEQEERYKIVEEVVGGPPSRRANASLTASPVANEILLFGGEFFNGEKVEFYNDLYRFSVDKSEWKKITSPNSPGPRSSHQVVVLPTGILFLLGGEFASANETQFFHYKDFWCMDLKTNTWERMDVRPKPSARSGHRMVGWKNFLVCFGGFYDNGLKVEYYGDLWIFDTTTYKWTKLEIQDANQKPSPRSGFQFISTADGILLYGGYCREVIKGQKPKGIVHTDMWFLRMNADPKLIKWERRKRAGTAPSPRSGCTMAVYKNRAILFGGVYDDDISEEKLDSVCFNEMYTYQIDSKRWYPLTLRKPSQGKKNKKDKRGAAPQGKSSGIRGGKKNKGRNDDDWSDKEDEKQRRLEAEGREKEEKAEEQRRDEEDGSDLEVDMEQDVDNAEHGDDIVGFDDVDMDRPDSPLLSDARKPEPAVVNTKMSSALGDETNPIVPCPRYNAMMCIQRNMLYLYGGILEHHEREYTLDDFFTLNLDKPTEFSVLQATEIEAQDWFGENSEDEADDDDDDDEEEEDEEMDDADEEEEDDQEEGKEEDDKIEQENAEIEMTPTKVKKERKKKSKKEEEEVVASPIDQDQQSSDTAYKGTAAQSGTGATEEDILKTPQPGESTRDFYARTSEYWTRVAFESGSTEVGKALRQIGFGLASARYNEYKPVLEEIERLRLEGMDGEEDGKNGSRRTGTTTGLSRNRR